MKKTILLFIFFSIQVFAQEPALVKEFIFNENYVLPMRAENLPGQVVNSPKQNFHSINVENTPVRFFGSIPNDRYQNILAENNLPEKNFSIELWIINHVNTPIGINAFVKNDNSVKWLIGYFDDKILFQLGDKSITGTAENSFKKYWNHLVGVFNGNSIRLYLNGFKIGEQELSQIPGIIGDFEIAGYFNDEEFMIIPNALKLCRIYDGVLSENEIKNRFAQLREHAEKGSFISNDFHFMAGPYLNYATDNSINILWESNVPSDAVIKFGESAEFPNVKHIPAKVNDAGTKHENYINEITLTGLKPSTQYFYEIILTDKNANSISSGILTFETAVKEGNPFSFAFIADTESRPHINDRISKLIWNERPDFIVNAGDLTDGGKENYKSQWTYEYFTGMNQISSRVPVYPVPGNGEGDLFWYNRYHSLPNGEEYYSFKYGDADFFMLNSNQSKEEFAPGGKQYVWLEEQLKNSDAKWKFVVHHHPTYTADEDDYGNTFTEGKSDFGDKNVRQILELYEMYDVDFTMFGHLHTYHRSNPVKNSVIDNDKGVIHLQSGGAGGNLEDFAPTKPWFSAKSFRGYHYCIISINGNVLELRMYDINGAMRDYLKIEKPKNKQSL